MAATEDNSIILRLDDEVEGEHRGSDDYCFIGIGEAVPIKPGDDAEFNPQNPPSKPLSISERFGLIFVSHSTGFCVARTKDIIDSAKEIAEKGSGSSIKDLSVVDVPIGQVYILALSADSSTLAACIDGKIHFFSVASVLNKDQSPFFSCSLDNSSCVKDMQWTKKLENYYAVLSNHGNLYYGAGQDPLKNVMDDVDAFDWSLKGNLVAVARKKTLSIMSLKLKEKVSISLSFDWWIGNSNLNFAIKVDSIRWVRPDSIILGCFQLTSDGKEENYLVQVITSKDGKFTDTSSKPTVLSFSDVFEAFVDDIVPFGSGPYMSLSYLSTCELAITANRKSTDQHIVLFGWSLNDRKDAAVIDIVRDTLCPKIALQGNGDDNIILGLCVDRISQNEKVEVQLGAEYKELSPFCILLCLSLDGKLFMYQVASVAGPSVPPDKVSLLSDEQDDTPTFVSSEDGKPSTFGGLVSKSVQVGFGFQSQGVDKKELLIKEGNAVGPMETDQVPIPKGINQVDTVLTLFSPNTVAMNACTELMEDRSLDLGQRIADVDPETPRFMPVKEGMHNSVVNPEDEVVKHQSDHLQIMPELAGKEQPKSQGDAQIVTSNEDVASNPDGNPVDQAARETTPEAQNNPIVPASGSHLVASPQSVNKAEMTINQSFSQTESELARLAAEIEAASQSLRSQTGSPESSLPSSFLQYGEGIQAQVNLFFDLLKIPFEEVVMNKSKELTECMSVLVQKNVFPLKEHIVLEHFFNTSNDTFSLFRRHSEEIHQKRELLSGFSSLSTKMSNLQFGVLSVKSKFSALEQEENSLLLRLGQILAEKNALLLEKKKYSREFEKLLEEGKGISAQAAAARADLLRNNIKRNEMIYRWETLLTFLNAEVFHSDTAASKSHSGSLTSSSPMLSTSSSPSSASVLSSLLLPSSLPDPTEKTSSLPISIGRSSTSSKPSTYGCQTALLSQSSSSSSSFLSSVSSYQVPEKAVPSAIPIPSMNFETETPKREQQHPIPKLTSTAEESSTVKSSSPKNEPGFSLKLESSLPFRPGGEPFANLQSVSKPSFDGMANHTMNAALNSKPGLSFATDASAALLSMSGSASGGKSESANVAVTQEDEMDEDAPETSQTNELTVGSLGSFGIGSSPNPTPGKPNPFGGAFGSVVSTPASSPFSMTVPTGELFRPASFSFQSPQPFQPSQLTNFGALSSGLSTGTTPQISAAGSGFGQPAQIGSGQQAFGSVVGEFGQSRQLGGVGPGTSPSSTSGFSGGLISSPSTGGFAAFASSTGGGFTGAASPGGGFAAAASAGGRFGGRGFGGITAAGGGFAAPASAGGGFAGAASGSGFPSSGGGSGAFNSQQGSGGFSAFGSSAGRTGRPPSPLFTQMRK